MLGFDVWGARVMFDEEMVMSLRSEIWDLGWLGWV